MGSHLPATMQLGKKPVKRLGLPQKRQRERRLAMSNVTGFLKMVVREIVRRVPEMQLDRAGVRFRKKQGNKAETNVIGSCEVLLEKLSIGHQDYCITSPPSPATAAALAGVASIEFWSGLGPLTEEDFFSAPGEGDPDMDNLTRTLRRTIIIEKGEVENRCDEASEDVDDGGNKDNAEETGNCDLDDTRSELEESDSISLPTTYVTSSDEEDEDGLEVMFITGYSGSESGNTEPRGASRNWINRFWITRLGAIHPRVGGRAQP